jgi:Holliday junction resolvase RusA-like endonuclease
MSFRLFLPMTPVAKARPRVTRFGTYTPDKTKQAQQSLQHLLGEYLRGAGRGFKKSSEPLMLVVTVQKIRPRSVPKKRIYPTQKPDVDNYAKLVMDACNGILWQDDSQVVTLLASKIYAEEEGVWIGVSEL